MTNNSGTRSYRGSRHSSQRSNESAHLRMIHPEKFLRRRHCRNAPGVEQYDARSQDRKSTRLNSSHGYISYAVFCLKKKKPSTGITCVPDHLEGSGWGLGMRVDIADLQPSEGVER